MRPDGLPHAVDNDARNGEAFFKQAVSYNWRERDAAKLTRIRPTISEPVNPIA